MECHTIENPTESVDGGQVVDPLLQLKGKQAGTKVVPWSKARAKALKRSNPWAGGSIT
jgi:hypothetical protein